MLYRSGAGLIRVTTTRLQPIDLSDKSLIVTSGLSSGHNSEARAFPEGDWPDCFPRFNFRIADYTGCAKPGNPADPTTRAPAQWINEPGGRMPVASHAVLTWSRFGQCSFWQFASRVTLLVWLGNNLERVRVNQWPADPLQTRPVRQTFFNRHWRWPWQDAAMLHTPCIVLVLHSHAAFPFSRCGFAC